ncbi:MAG: GNAT family N-acetyltransferase [Hydrogeniiclostridium mannosilyticum]
MQWRAPAARAVGLGRFAVHPIIRGAAWGFLAIREAGASRGRGAQYLRLFVMPVNRPAIRFYERAGFTRAAGVHEEVIDAALTLREYGFEIETADTENKKRRSCDRYGR